MRQTTANRRSDAHGSCSLLLVSAVAVNIAVELLSTKMSSDAPGRERARLSPAVLGSCCVGRNHIEKFIFFPDGSAFDHTPRGGGCAKSDGLSWSGPNPDRAAEQSGHWAPSDAIMEVTVIS